MASKDNACQPGGSSAAHASSHQVLMTSVEQLREASRAASEAASLKAQAHLIRVRFAILDALTRVTLGIQDMESLKTSGLQL